MDPPWASGVVPGRGEPFVGKLCEKKALKLLKTRFCMKRKKSMKSKKINQMYIIIITIFIIIIIICVSLVTPWALGVVPGRGEPFLG